MMLNALSPTDSEAHTCFKKLLSDSFRFNDCRFGLKFMSCHAPYEDFHAGPFSVVVSYLYCNIQDAV